MDDSDDLEQGGGPLIVSENDADQNFGLSATAVVQGCSSGSSGSSSCSVSPNKKHWVEIALFDEEGNPVQGKAYQITVPDGTVIEGATDGKGRGRVDGIDAGTCKITFPNLDKDSWKKR